MHQRIHSNTQTTAKMFLDDLDEEDYEIAIKVSALINSHDKPDCYHKFQLKTMSFMKEYS